jgi:hypothetical protein
VRGIFCIDPGASTGIAWAIIDETSRVKTSIEIVRTREFSTSKTLTGTEPEQIRDLYNFWTGFKKICVQGHDIPPECVDLVIEDFVLFPGEKPGRATTIPERISWGFEGYRMAMRDSFRRSSPKHYPEINWQKSGAAHRFNNRDILTRASAWIVGRQHERAAFAHMILRTNILLDRQH